MSNPHPLAPDNQTPYLPDPYLFDRIVMRRATTLQGLATAAETTIWTKTPTPVFTSNTATGQYGPGHNSFTTSEDGRSDEAYNLAGSYVRHYDYLLVTQPADTATARADATFHAE